MVAAHSPRSVYDISALCFTVLSCASGPLHVYYQGGHDKVLTAVVDRNIQGNDILVVTLSTATATDCDNRKANVRGVTVPTLEI